ncbi:hypothetical protein HDV06_001130 [Boothiomyces sp. JEL0866]|nr:hypothetical protein HDV06_001130 [Boothiomyces sp. JEL0866]
MKIDLEHLDNDERNVFMISLAYTKNETIKHLFDLTLNKNIIDKDGYNPLLYYSFNTNKLEKEILEMLISINDINFFNTNSNHGLLKILIKKDVSFDIIEWCIENGAKIDIEDNEGNTPLMIYCGKGDLSKFKKLIACGADYNHTNKKGINCAMVAASKNNTHILQYLNTLEVDFSIKDYNGKNALNYAKDCDQIDAITYLNNLFLNL